MRGCGRNDERDGGLRGSLRARQQQRKPGRGAHGANDETDRRDRAPGIVAIKLIRVDDIYVAIIVRASRLVVVVTALDDETARCADDDAWSAEPDWPTANRRAGRKWRARSSRPASSRAWTRRSSGSWKERPAWVPKAKVSALEGIELIHQAGGLAVMAHPGLNRTDEIIPALADAGLDGIECFHTKHSPACRRGSGNRGPVSSARDGRFRLPRLQQGQAAHRRHQVPYERVDRKGRRVLALARASADGTALQLLVGDQGYVHLATGVEDAVGLGRAVRQAVVDLVGRERYPVGWLGMSAASCICATSQLLIPVARIFPRPLTAPWPWPSSKCPPRGGG